jgi:hypothetical protein
MNIEQKTILFSEYKVGNSVDSFGFVPDLVLIFGESKFLNESGIPAAYKDLYKDCIVTGCSTSGEIYDQTVSDNSLSITAIKFEKTRLEFHSVSASTNSENAGHELVKKFSAEGMRHLFLLSDGLKVNGSDLVEGILKVLPNDVNVTGGLAGDGADFKITYVVDDGKVETGVISAVAFYGESIEVGYGSLGGWTSFGIERSVTRSEGNILYELDSLPALEIYKSYLGDQADKLPASGLLFPLSLRTDPEKEPVVRTILAIDDEAQSMTFAGDIQEGAYVKLMKANVDGLIDGAEGAAKVSYVKGTTSPPECAILISCVGRKLVLKQLVEEEVEAVKEVLGEQCYLTGFYSYGELAPFQQGTACELHNQTMTITTFSEK